jgi:hypothetical protein
MILIIYLTAMSECVITSYSVMLQKFYNNIVEHYSMVDHEQTKDNSNSKKDITDKRDS